MVSRSTLLAGGAILVALLALSGWAPYDRDTVLTQQNLLNSSR